MNQEQEPLFAPSSFEVRTTPFYLLLRILVLELVITGFYLLFRAISNFTTLEWLNTFYLDNQFFILGSMQVLNVLLIISMLLAWLNRYYTIVPEELRVTSGLVTKRTITYDIRSLQSVTVDQTLMGRLFNFGTIHLYNPAWTQEVVIEDITHPERYAEIFSLHNNDGATFLRSR